MKILIADDHPLFRDGIASLLKAKGLDVVGQAEDGLEAVEKAKALRPDIVLMDIKMPRCDGLEAMRLIKVEQPELKVVMLTVSEEEEDVFEAMKSGAHGYLLKNVRSAEFFDLLSAVDKGEIVISPFLAGKILHEFAHKEARQVTSASELTAREEEVLHLVAKGAANKEIAQTLNITENTVKYHMKNIMSKLHLVNRAQMASYAATRDIETGAKKAPPQG
ncbi:MAG: response regulator transcription factor [Chloroflexi bacterium]|nr:response regulator transcription factor [Chloroflexota bacterium]